MSDKPHCTAPNLCFVDLDYQDFMLQVCTQIQAIAVYDNDSTVFMT